MLIKNLIRENIKSLEAYSSARDEFKEMSSEPIFIDANENPFETGLNRYPDPQQNLVKDALFSSKGVSKEQILLGNGSDYGILLKYKEQPSPDGLAQAFIIGEKFIGNDDVCMILGDNIFNGHGFSDLLKKAIHNVKKLKMATIFGYYMNDAKRYGVIEFSKKGKPLSIEEKPEIPKGNHAIVGLYFYPNSVIQIAKDVKISERGEFEISSINQQYLKKNKLKVEVMGRGFAWLDTGTHESLIEASNYIKTIESRQGLKIACLEDIAFQMGYISKNKLLSLAKNMINSGYGHYLIQRSKEK